MTTKSFRFKPSEIGIFREEGAGRAIEGFAPGCHLMGLTMGQFSLIDLIHSVLKKTGAADVYIATWSAGIKDAHQVAWLRDTDLIRGIRLLTDHSYVNRQRKYAIAIEDLFGKENIRCSEMHAKFVVIKNAEYNVVMLSSMNLNANRTCETFVLYENKEITDFYTDFVNHHFENMQDGWERSSTVVRECVEGFFAAHNAANALPVNPHVTRHWSEI